MVEIKDRRSFDRFLCPGVTALIYKKYWYQNLRYKVLKNITIFMPETSNIKNISSSGILILCKNVFRRGDKICIAISAPGIKTIMIKGIVCWNIQGTVDVEQVGIQFSAFSSWKKYNSINLQKQLNLFLSKTQSSLIEYRQ